MSNNSAFSHIKASKGAKSIIAGLLFNFAAQLGELRGDMTDG